MINGLLEIRRTKIWMMEPEALFAYEKTMRANFNGHVTLDASKIIKKKPYCIGMTAEGQHIRMAAPGSMVEHSDNEPEVKSFVAILPVCGPITRNGGACSYGSVDIRDAMIEAANIEECVGIVLYINTNGGAADAIHDFRYGINVAHENGKKVIAYVDGECASAGMYLASACDERYYMNEHDRIGSIGVMAAFHTEKDGDKNEYTNETFHHLYAEQSYEKNKWYRDASEGDYELIQKELNELADTFMADIKAACPNVEDKHLHGAMFEASEIDGILMDGKATLAEVVAKFNEPATAPGASASQAQTTNTTIDMTNYPLTQAALGVEELAVNEEGTFINAALLDTMEQNLQTAETAKAEAAQKLADAEKALADAQAHAKEIEEQLATAQADKESADKALADAQEAHSKEIAELNANLDKVKGEHTEAIAKKDEEIATLTSAKAEADEALKGAKEALATAEQTIADKDAQIAELSNDPGNEPAQGAAPQNNGEGAQVPEMKSGIPQFDPANPVESKAAIDAYLANVRKG